MSLVKKIGGASLLVGAATGAQLLRNKSEDNSATEASIQANRTVQVARNGSVYIGTEVENTGEQEAELVVGATFIGPDGTAFDLPPFRTSRLRPGETGGVDWSNVTEACIHETKESGVELFDKLGNYDLKIAVWADSTENFDECFNTSLQNNLDRVTVRDAVKVVSGVSGQVQNVVVNDKTLFG